MDQSYAFLFADAAKLQVLQPLPGQDAFFTLASAGVGVRFRDAGFSVALDGARILLPVCLWHRLRTLICCLFLSIRPCNQGRQGFDNLPLNE